MREKKARRELRRKVSLLSRLAKIAGSAPPPVQISKGELRELVDCIDAYDLIFAKLYTRCGRELGILKRART